MANTHKLIIPSPGSNLSTVCAARINSLIIRVSSCFSRSDLFSGSFESLSNLLKALIDSIKSCLALLIWVINLAASSVGGSRFSSGMSGGGCTFLTTSGLSGPRLFGGGWFFDFSFTPPFAGRISFSCLFFSVCGRSSIDNLL